jgi:hypothetical protein
MALCLAAAGITLQLAANAFTLGWSHTVEHLPWREGWRVAGDRLVLDTVRIKGSGAGIDPPPEARLVDGWYVWRPADETRARIVLRRAADPDGVIGDWQFCAEGEPCRALGDLVGRDADPVTLYPCS